MRELRGSGKDFTFLGVGAGGGSPQGYPSIPAGRGLASRTYKSLDFVRTLSYCTYMKKPIQIRVEDGDLEDWTRKAGESGKSLSAWIRERCNGVADNKAEGMRGVAGVPAVAGSFIAEVGDVPIAEKPKAGVRTCVHGVAKGWHCWQCRGVAVV